MMEEGLDGIKYSILDPTGNITALVESPVEADQQPALAAKLMQFHPEVEQVGFVDFNSHPALRMAGGEFCGNASLCAAALYLLHEATDQKQTVVHLHVSGADASVEVQLTRESKDCFSGCIHMPKSSGIKEMRLASGHTSAQLPLVSMGGISHIIIEPDSAFAELVNNQSAAETAIKKWCKALKLDGLGLMFLSQNKKTPATADVKSVEYEIEYCLTPLGYIPGSGTIFWENSCASGSAAAGIYLAKKNGNFLDLSLLEPGGKLRVTSDPETGETCLNGMVKLISQTDNALS
jgi:diaminopimelate epimerase